MLDDTAAQWIADKGFDPAMGARPMQRIFDLKMVNVHRKRNIIW